METVKILLSRKQAQSTLFTQMIGIDGVARHPIFLERHQSVGSPDSLYGALTFNFPCLTFPDHYWKVVACFEIDNFESESKSQCHGFFSFARFDGQNKFEDEFFIDFTPEINEQHPIFTVELTKITHDDFNWESFSHYYVNKNYYLDEEWGLFMIVENSQKGVKGLSEGNHFVKVEPIKSGTDIMDKPEHPLSGIDALKDEQLHCYSAFRICHALGELDRFVENEMGNCQIGIIEGDKHIMEKEIHLEGMLAVAEKQTYLSPFKNKEVSWINTLVRTNKVSLQSRQWVQYRFGIASSGYPEEMRLMGPDAVAFAEFEVILGMDKGKNTEPIRAKDFHDNAELKLNPEVWDEIRNRGRRKDYLSAGWFQIGIIEKGTLPHLDECLADKAEPYHSICMAVFCKPTKSKKANKDPEWRVKTVLFVNSASKNAFNLSEEAYFELLSAENYSMKSAIFLEMQSARPALIQPW